MKITREEVIKIAEISKIALHENEIDLLVKQLQDILAYSACVQKIADETADLPSNRNVNFFREDVVMESMSEAVLGQAPESEEGYFVVPKILDTK